MSPDLDAAAVRALLDSAPDAFVIVDRSGTIRRVNAQAERLFGWSREELVGRPVEMLVPPRFQERHAAHREGYAREPRFRPMGIGLDLRGLRKDGTEFPVEISLSPLELPEGVLFTAAVRDVTERRRADARFRALLELAPDAFVMVDRQGRIAMVNAQTERLFGYGRDELLGQPMELLVPERFRGVHAGHRETYHLEPRFRPMGAGLDLYARRRDGSEFPVEISLSPLDTEEGTVVTAAIRDVSERARAAEELRQLNETLERRVTERTALAELRAEELARSNAELERFASVAAHDLQEPLRCIVVNLQLLQRSVAGALPSEAGGYLEQAVTAAHRTSALIQDLLTYSRLDRDPVRLQVVDAGEVLLETLHLLGGPLTSSGAEVTHDPLPRVRAVESQVGQLFQNLIANAVKFRGPEPPRVHVSAARRGGHWEFRVQDNGIGIAPQHFERIFVVFQRLHVAEDYPGTGIGLAICKKIVERHGGRIWVESQRGRGSTFFFTLPAADELPAQPPGSASAVSAGGTVPPRP